MAITDLVSLDRTFERPKLESVCDSDARTCSAESLAFPFVLPFRSLDLPGWLQTTTLSVPATPAKDQLLDLV